MSQAIQGIRLAVTTTGGAGSASGDNTTSGKGIRGALMSVRLDYHASAPGASTDLTITEIGGAGRTLLTLTNTATDGEYPIRIAETGTTGTALATYTPILLDGVQLKVALAQCDALTDAVVAYFYILT